MKLNEPDYKIFGTYLMGEWVNGDEPMQFRQSICCSHIQLRLR